MPGHELYRRGHSVAFVDKESASIAMQSDVLIVQRQYTQSALDAIREARSWLGRAEAIMRRAMPPEPPPQPPREPPPAPAKAP